MAGKPTAAHRELFERAAVHEGARVTVSYVQLYNEELSELLDGGEGAAKGRPVRVREHFQISFILPHVDIL